MLPQSRFGLYLAFLAAVATTMPYEPVTPYETMKQLLRNDAVKTESNPNLEPRKIPLPEPPPHPQDLHKQKFKVLGYFTPRLKANVELIKLRADFILAQGRSFLIVSY